jgi:hypothetical protein
MKKPAVPTTTARGAAVSSSRMTAVQSVYIAPNACAPPSSQLGRLRLVRLALRVCWLGLLVAPVLAASPLRADVVFENCQPAGDGGITCDTRPTGNTLMDDEDARFGLLQQASPGWNEFEPYEGYDAMVGGNET